MTQSDQKDTSFRNPVFSKEYNVSFCSRLRSYSSLVTLTDHPPVGAFLLQGLACSPLELSAQQCTK